MSGVRQNATKSATKQREIAREFDLFLMEEATAFPYKLSRLYDQNGDTAKRWCIEFYVWDSSKSELSRQRLYKGFNHIKNKRERLKACKEIIQEINRMLVEGYVIGAEHNHEMARIELMMKPKLITIMEAYREYFGMKKEELRRSSIRSYGTLERVLQEWLKGKKIPNILLNQWNTELSIQFSEHIRGTGIAAKTFNNYMTLFNAFFNHCVNRDLIPKNPNKVVRKKKVESGKHVPFSRQQMTLILDEVNKQGLDQLSVFIHFAYYTLARPGTELRLLQVKNIRERTIFIEAEKAKNGKGQHIIIPPQLETLIKERKFRDYPGNYYVFGRGGKPGDKPVGINHFYERHRDILKDLGLYGQDDYDLYSWKHTGVISLYNAGVDIKSIQMQCRHSTIHQTDKYMKDLGLFRNEDVLMNYPTL
jgi:integrase